MQELTAEDLRRLLDSDNRSVAMAAGRDQRRSRRSSVETHATLMPLSAQFNPPNVRVAVRDLSRGGFGFLHDRKLPLGEQFALLLPEDTGRPVVIVCTVAYWQPLADGRYAIGARFSQILREDGAGLPLILSDAVSGELTLALAA